MIRPKVELIKTRGISEVIDDSALFIKQNWKGLLKAYFSICGFFWIAALALSVFNQLHFQARVAAGEFGYDSTIFFTLFFEFLNFTAVTLTGLSFMSLYHQKNNEAPTTAEVWAFVKYYFLRVFASNIMVVAGLALGTLCCFFPGVYLWPVFSLVAVIIVIDNYPVGRAFSYSFELIAKKWGQVFGVLILCLFLVVSVWILFLIPLFIIVGLSVFSGLVTTAKVFPIVFNLSVHLIQFVYIFPLVALTLSYFNLKEFKEDHALFERIKNLGRQPEKGLTDTASQAEEQY